MAVCINDNHILCYNMDAFRSTMIGCSYFICPNYLVAKGWIRAMLLHPTNILLAGPNVHCF